MCKMIKFERTSLGSYSQENTFPSIKMEKSYTNIYALASNLGYSDKSYNESTQLGNTLISLF